ncbi:hypothetical protein [Herbidospora cretacea]|uniref:hypothetical protein n=1 Tax=Herbidospora cretacea TaxID=28444 RepID=UPI00077425FB|nr:hypothetical protein [Herbidospora cretacea]
MDSDDLGDEEWVCQYGTIHSPIDGKPFKCRPSIGEDPQELSLIRGRLDVDKVALMIQRRRPRHVGAMPGEGARHAKVADLRAAGFRVWATPTRANPFHVSVMPLDLQGTWTQDDMERFEGCFEPPDWKEGQL